MRREKINTLNERDLLYGLITSEKFCREICPILNPRLLEIDYVRILSGWIQSYYNEFKVNPERDIIKIYRSHADELNDEALKDNILTFLDKLDKEYDSIKSFNDEYALSQTILYLKKQSLKNLNTDIDAFLTTGDITKAENSITKYKTIEKSSGKAVSLFHGLESIVDSYSEEKSTLFTLPKAYGKVVGKIHREDFISFLAPMKRGKCLAKGTKILMFDGSVKEVQDLMVGDKLMGDDSTPRTVLSTSIGHGQMYRVSSNVNPLCKDKTPDIDFTCNGDHILVLKNVWKDEKSEIKEYRKDGHKNGELKKNGKNNILKKDEIEISVEDFIKLSDYQKQRFKLFRKGVEYLNVNHTISPYFIGLWLGDGTTSNCDITTTDKEVIDYCYDEATRLFDNVKIYNDKNVKVIRFNKNGKESFIHKEFKRLNLLNNKHIPYEYKVDSRNNRLELLAGMIDTDGYMSKDGKCYEICLMNKTLAFDIKTLCEQLGFRTKFREHYNYYKGMYDETKGWKYSWSIQIYGRLSEIPCKLERKKAKDNNKYNSLNNTFSFNITSVGEDDYYGFVLDGNHRFLLADTTVSHNTWQLIDVGVNAVSQGMKVLFVTLEMSESDMIKRFWTALTGQINEDRDDIDYPYFEENSNGKYSIEHKTISRKAVSIAEIEKKQKSLKRMFRGGDIRMLAVPAYSLSPDQLDTEIERMEQQEDFIPDVIIVDYADIMQPVEKGEYRHQIDGIWKRLRSLAQKRKAVVFTASQSGRSSLGRDVDSEDISEDIRKLAHVTSMVSLNQNSKEKKEGILRLKQLAVREGEMEFKQAICTQCLAIGRIVTDSKFEDEVEIDNSDESDETFDKNRRKRS